MLKLFSCGKGLTGGFADPTSVWQIVQIGPVEAANSCAWQPEQGVCPERTGRAELLSRRWHSRQGSRSCAGLL